jgi:hypothetical protein
MNTIKITVITLALMTTAAFADFTIKDLFVSGGTTSSEDGKKDKADSKSTDEIVHTQYK